MKIKRDTLIIFDWVLEDEMGLFLIPADEVPDWIESIDDQYVNATGDTNIIDLITIVQAAIKDSPGVFDDEIREGIDDVGRQKEYDRLICQWHKYKITKDEGFALRGTTGPVDIVITGFVP